ncbi:hypothetical protein [Vreelandella venusta]|nr:hypothetical protein [Halomonas venusta]MDX1713690.1 hypothetical protein [Halomonas venusta]
MLYHGLTIAWLLLGALLEVWLRLDQRIVHGFVRQEAKPVLTQ